MNWEMSFRFCLSTLGTKRGLGEVLHYRAILGSSFHPLRRRDSPSQPMNPLLRMILSKQHLVHNTIEGCKK